MRPVYSAFFLKAAVYSGFHFASGLLKKGLNLGF
jgi:hypothetical protein